MRSTQEMLDLILNIALEDDRIRAVILNGSRTVTDCKQVYLFQDFDVVYVVNDMAFFRANLHWIDRFGERMILQLPDDMDAGEGFCPIDHHYTYLMQFMDGNRIDLGIHPIDKIDKLYEDSQTIVLLDKDGLLKPFPPASNASYLPKPPTPKQYADCCNEFWWVSPYVAKGLWRRQIFYAKNALEKYVRAQLDKMVVWYIGMQTGWKVSLGSGGKYIPKYLEPELWQMYLHTWAGADYDEVWNALLATGPLFRQMALAVAARFGFDYPYQEDKRVSAYLQHIRDLPRDSKEIY